MYLGKIIQRQSATALRLSVFLLGLLAILIALTGPHSAAAQRIGAKPMEVRAPEFPKGFAWLNTDQALAFKNQLKGQVVLLDFWTYCCINCMHVIPELAQLEKKFADEPFVVVGVHSNKFDNEASLANIRAAVQRYEVRHPVVVDQQMQIWNSYGVNSWPTLVLVGSDGKIIGAVSGEGHGKVLESAITAALKAGREKGTLAKAPLKLATEGTVRSASGLAFPGKVLVDEKNRRLLIADSNHHRVVITGWPDEHGTAALQMVIGDGTAGAVDGPFDKARFHRPQGLTLAGETLWIADTENHLIRAADLKNKTVRTVLGTGKQEFDREGGKTGRQQGLNSPWDVAAQGNKLYIAMAGQHQIFVMNTLTSMAEVYAGSGRENIRDDVLADANLAQPSGLALDATQARLYFADSEVSALRCVDMKAGRVETIIGHGLFDFGDRDGNAATARFQHCLGVALFGEKLLLADTYNHKIKLVDPVKKTAVTFAGTGKPGTGIPGGAAGFFEPASVAAAGETVFVADTNNHRIVMIDAKSKAWREVMIAGLAAPAAAGPVNAANVTALGALKLAADDVTLQITPRVPAASHLTPGAPVSVQVLINGQSVYQQTLDDGQTLPLTFRIPRRSVSAGEWTIRFYYATCADGKESVCTPAQSAWKADVALAETGTREVKLR